MSGSASSAPYRAPAVTRFWFWCGAFDHRLITTPVEAIRAAQVGMLVFLVGVIASVTFGLYATVVHGRLTPLTACFAVLWGIVVFCIDRSILGDPHYGDLTEAERAGDAAAGGPPCPRSAAPSPPTG
ncbi:DUF4407 domain-containing protein, partial [Dactylosporangium sp. NPDC005572]|uniref:DUF4407 domain-containing protein n=1 Tax=Dactylosporangium sp. NPDC005572 TaxID=3156889 RepID=UPI0033B63950